VKVIRGAAFAAALVTAATMFVNPVPASAATAKAAIGCVDGSDPSGFPGISTKRRNTGYWYGIVELRYSSNTCAWGRLTYGQPGDLVWVDRAPSQPEGDAGNREQLGVTYLTSGNQVYTGAYNDNHVVMRACVLLHDNPDGDEIVCTGWY
jgi:hypothetical protein